MSHFFPMDGLLENIIPKPLYANTVEGQPLKIDRFTIIVYDKKFQDQAYYLSDLVYDQTDIRLRVLPETNFKNEGVYIKIGCPDEGFKHCGMYQIKAYDNVISLLAENIEGLVHAIQSLLQVFPIRKVKSLNISPFLIKDYPRFKYRGMHLDVSRHFYPLNAIKKYIEYLAHHKFNYFHWHLTDDQGWRIEIKAYPKLTETGAWRKATLIGHFFDEPALYHEKEYGGFYTQDEIKEVIEYAQIRGITVVPEIDIPGHSRAAIAAYPELGTQPETHYEVATTWGMFNRQNNVLAPREETFKFIEKVFEEVSELFPGSFVHIGGDECSKIWWEQSRQAQDFIKKNALKDEKGLQTYIVNNTANYLNRLQKKVIAWNDVLEGDADKSVIIMNWGAEAAAVGALKKGHQVIATPGKPLYFDHYQKEEKNEPLAIHGYNKLQAVYDFEPVPAEIKGSHLQQQILGAQGNVWTEYMGTFSKVEYMIFPRMTALSEVLWSAPENRNFKKFKERLIKNMLSRYKLWGVTYCEP